MNFKFFSLANVNIAESETADEEEEVAVTRSETTTYLNANVWAIEKLITDSQTIRHLSEIITPNVALAHFVLLLVDEPLFRLQD